MYLKEASYHLTSKWGVLSWFTWDWSGPVQTDLVSSGLFWFWPDWAGSGSDKDWSDGDWSGQLGPDETALVSGWAPRVMSTHVGKIPLVQDLSFLNHYIYIVYNITLGHNHVLHIRVYTRSISGQVLVSGRTELSIYLYSRIFIWIPII